MTLRNTLLIGQIAVSLLLLSSAGLFIRSLLTLQSEDLGFDDEGLTVMLVDAREAGYEGPAAANVLSELRDQIEALPGVQAVTRTTRLPVTPGGGSTTLLVPGSDASDSEKTAEVRFSLIEDDYFTTLGIPIIRGRTFLPEERSTYSPVALVNRTFAENLMGGLDAVGRSYRHENDPETRIQIVGVVENSKIESPNEGPTPVLYRVLPFRARIYRLYYVARTSVDPAQTAGLMREQVQSLDPRIPIYQVEPMARHVARSLDSPRLAAQFLTTFGLLALVIAALGLYSVVSYLAAQRKAEIGIRVALGSTRSGVVLFFLKRTLRVTALGVAIGLVLVAAATPLIRNFVFNVPTFDPLTLGLVAGLLLLVAALASYLPARRAARQDPLQSIRS